MQARAAQGSEKQSYEDLENEVADIWNSAHELSMERIITTSQAGIAQPAATLVQLHENIVYHLQLPGPGDKFLAHVHCLMLTELGANWNLEHLYNHIIIIH